MDPIQKRAPARSVQLEAVYLEALLHVDFAGIIWILHLLFLNSISLYFDRMKSGLLNQEFAMTATFSHVDDIIFNDITFKNQLTYLGLPQMKAYYDITISFRFKTIEMNGKFIF